MKKFLKNFWNCLISFFREPLFYFLMVVSTIKIDSMAGKAAAAATIWLGLASVKKILDWFSERRQK